MYWLEVFLSHYHMIKFIVRNKFTLEIVLLIQEILDMFGQVTRIQCLLHYLVSLVLTFLYLSFCGFFYTYHAPLCSHRSLALYHRLIINSFRSLQARNYLINHWFSKFAALFISGNVRFRRIIFIIIITMVRNLWQSALKNKSFLLLMGLWRTIMIRWVLLNIYGKCLNWIPLML